MQHHVYFWLKEERQNEADRATFEAGLNKLGKISYIQDCGWGKPAATPKRPVVDNSYDYGVYSTFATVADHDAYQVDPQHDEFVENFKDWWANVSIMDVE